MYTITIDVGKARIDDQFKFCCVVRFESCLEVLLDEVTMNLTDTCCHVFTNHVVSFRRFYLRNLFGVYDVCERNPVIRFTQVIVLHQSQTNSITVCTRRRTVGCRTLVIEQCVIVRRGNDVFCYFENNLSSEVLSVLGQVDTLLRREDKTSHCEERTFTSCICKTPTVSRVCGSVG